MSARTRHRNAVEDLEEVEVEPICQRRRGPIGRGQPRPVAKRRLRVAEYLIDRLVEPELFRPCVGVALIGELELVVQIAEPVVDGGCRKHQDLRLDSVLDDLVEEPLKAISLRLVLDLGRGVCTVAEVMGLVDDDEIVGAPVELLEVVALDRQSLVTGQVGVVEHVVAQAIGGNRVVNVVLFVREPVVREALGAEHEHVAVEQLIVLNDREGSERLAQADAVCEDAAVVGLEFVDDG